jgi:phosphatidylinositol alpha-1,6-mannosyltransferase
MNKKILLISTEFPPGPGGIGQHAYSLAKALTDIGYHLAVLTNSDYTSNEEGKLFDSIQQFTVKRYPRYSNFFTYIARIFISIRTIVKEYPEIIILTGKFSLWQGVLIKLIRKDIQTIAILHGTEINLPNQLLKKWTHYAISKADKLVPVSNFTKSLLPQALQKNSSIKVIVNGIEKNMLDHDASEKINLKGNPKLITVGHVSPRKGQHNVILALPELIKVFPEIHYHMVGRPICQNKLEKLAKELGVKDNITFHGRIPNHDNLSAYYRSSDIFMLLSENLPNGDVEGFGIVALEANCFGVPVIGSYDSGVAEAVRHNHSGILVNSKNPKEILNAVEYCLDNKKRLAVEAQNWASTHEWSKVVLSFEEILK